MREGGSVISRALPTLALAPALIIGERQAGPAGGSLHLSQAPEPTAQENPVLRASTMITPKLPIGGQLMGKFDRIILCPQLRWSMLIFFFATFPSLSVHVVDVNMSFMTKEHGDDIFTACRNLPKSCLYFLIIIDKKNTHLYWFARIIYCWGLSCTP